MISIVTPGGVRSASIGNDRGTSDAQDRVWVHAIGLLRVCRAAEAHIRETVGGTSPPTLALGTAVKGCIAAAADHPIFPGHRSTWLRPRLRLEIVLRIARQ